MHLPKISFKGGQTSDWGATVPLTPLPFRTVRVVNTPAGRTDGRPVAVHQVRLQGGQRGAGGGNGHTTGLSQTGT